MSLVFPLFLTFFISGILIVYWFNSYAMRVRTFDFGSKTEKKLCRYTHATQQHSWETIGVHLKNKTKKKIRVVYVKLFNNGIEMWWMLWTVVDLNCFLWSDTETATTTTTTTRAIISTEVAHFNVDMMIDWIYMEHWTAWYIYLFRSGIENNWNKQQNRILRKFIEIFGNIHNHVQDNGVVKCSKWQLMRISKYILHGVNIICIWIGIVFRIENRIFSRPSNEK